MKRSISEGRREFLAFLGAFPLGLLGVRIWSKGYVNGEPFLNPSYW